MSRALLHTNTSSGVLNPFAWSTITMVSFHCETDGAGEKMCSLFILLAFLIFRKTEVSKAPMAASEGLKDHAWGSGVVHWEGSTSSPDVLGHRTTMQGGRCFRANVLCAWWALFSLQEFQALFSFSGLSLCPGFSQSLSPVVRSCLLINTLCLSKVLYLAVALLFTER